MNCFPLIRFAMSFSMVTALAAATPSTVAPRGLGDLTGDWQLLVDDHLVESKQGVERRYHAFSKHPANPVLTATEPWEGRSVYLYGSVLPSETGRGYRAWYHGASSRDTYFSAYATSEDGLTWSKRPLGQVEWSGSRENNLFLQRTHEDHLPQVLHTPWDPDPKRKYRMLNYDYARTPPLHIESGYWGAYSPDGIAWTDAPCNPVLRDQGDVASFNWDPHTARYVGYTKVRNVPVRGALRRSIGFTATRDFESWPSSQLILVPDEFDDRWVTKPLQRTDFYGLSAFAYESMYLGFLWVFRITDGRNDGTIHCELVSSRDGVTWLRPEGERTPLLPVGKEGSWDDGQVVTPNHPIVEGDRITLFYGGLDATHQPPPGSPPRRDGIGLAHLRKDGFASLNAGPQVGEIVTRRLRGLTGSLRVNADTAGGELRVEVLDEQGQVVPGYSHQECRAVVGNGCDLPVTWMRHVTLPPNAGSLRLRFVLREGALYSFRAGGPIALAEPPKPKELKVEFAEATADYRLVGSARRDRGTDGNPVVILASETGKGPGSLELVGTSHLGAHFTLSARVQLKGRNTQRLFSTYRGSGEFSAGELVFDVHPRSGVLRLVVNGQRVYGRPRYLKPDQPHDFAAVYDRGRVVLSVDGAEVARSGVRFGTVHLYDRSGAAEYFDRPDALPDVGIHLASDLRVGADTEKSEAQLEGMISKVGVSWGASSPVPEAGDGK